jgi:hypothetical protein
VSTEPEAGATIRLVDVFAKQIEMAAQLAVLTDRLNQLPDHEVRLRAVERRQWQIPASAIGSVTAVCGSVAAILKALH